MKVKLLKKVRKQFSIHKIVKLSKYPISEELTFDYNLPFYKIVEDPNYSSYPLRYIIPRVSYKLTLHDSKDVILRWIREDYHRLKKHTPSTYKKVWF